MKITVQDERVFPTLGIIAQPGDEVELPEETSDADTKDKPAKAKTVKEGDDDGSAS